MRAVAIGAIAFTVFHIFASFLWISPPTALRQLLPGDILRAYMLPWFGQSWSVFAPEPINGDYKLKVRAVLATKHGLVTTKWVAASDVEQSMSHHNLFPPRAAGLAVQEASALKDTGDVLTSEQKNTAALNYFAGDSWLGRERDAMLAEGDNHSAVIDFIVQERYADAYATQVAESTWGDEVVRVQYEASRQNVVPYADRKSPHAERPTVQIFRTGWRGLITLPDQDSTSFHELFPADPSTADTGRGRTDAH